MKVIDMHCDTISVIARERKAGIKIGLDHNNLHVDIKKMKKGNYFSQNFAMFIDLKECQDPFSTCMEMIDFYEHLLLDNKNDIAAVYSYEDLKRNHLNGKISALLTIEEGGVCKGNIDFLKVFYNRGVRMMTLLWNYENELGYPNGFLLEENANRGLKEKGIEFIWNMEEMGMIVDVSHISDEGFYEVIKHSKKPFVASHSNARALSPHARNLTDDMIYKLAIKGGVIGLNFCPFFLDKNTNKKEAKSRVDYIINHMKHIVNIGGLNCLGLGSDFDGMTGELELENASFLPILGGEMIKSGFKTNEIEAIFYKNILDLYKEVL